MDKKALKEHIRRAKNDIFYFAEHFLRAHPAGDQVKFLQVVQDLTLNEDQVPKQFGAKAGTGLGKTWCLAIAVLWRWFRSKGSMHVNTAPTERQCREVFFQEISNHIGNSPILGPMVNLGGAKLTMKDYPHWKIMAATASDENAIRGLHHPDMTIAVEELTGIREEIIAALLRTCSQKNNLFIAIFNPDRPAGTAYEMFHSRRVHWPWNITMNKLSLATERPDLVDPGKIELVREEFGEDSDMWRVGVLGQFPLQGAANVMSIPLVEKAQETNMGLGIGSGPAVRVISLDFARFGGDSNVIAARSGNAIPLFEEMVCDPNEAVLRAFEIPAELGWAEDTIVWVIDGIGIGQGMAWHFLERDLNLIMFHPNSPSPVEGYANLASAAWFNLRNKLRNETVHLPEDEELQQQLTTRLYTTEKVKGVDVFKVETKKDYKKRGFKSPDKADAIIQAFCEDVELMDQQVVDQNDLFGRTDSEDLFSPTPDWNMFS